MRSAGTFVRLGRGDTEEEGVFVTTGIEYKLFTVEKVRLCARKGAS